MFKFSPSIKAKDERGFSLLELMYIVIVVSILFSAVLLVLRPNELRARARDNTRLSDLAVLERALGEYFLSSESYPGSVSVLYKSTSLPNGAQSPLYNAQSGWLGVNMSEYMSKLPIDPTNDAFYFYSYQKTDSAFELNATLEFLTEYAASDGGDDVNVYELGNDLTII